MMSGEELLGIDELPTGELRDLCGYAVSQTGKQLRSRLVCEASRLGECDRPTVKTAARAVELLHIATLAHDDVIDDSPLRHGHASLDHMHGGFAAGYTGAWLFGTAVELAAECGQEAVTSFVDTACELCEGEMLEIQDLYNTARVDERYFAAIAGKTASLFSLSARLGGLAAGAPPSAAAKLDSYGESMGMAFQLADDILDLLSDREGNKRSGDDLRHGVFTLPVIYAIGADSSVGEALDGEIDEETIEQVVAAVRSTGALQRAFAICDEFADAARAAARELAAPWLESFVAGALAPLQAVRPS